jgi:hypothetical protein
MHCGRDQSLSRGACALNVALPPQAGAELTPTHPDSFSYLNLSIYDKEWADLVGYLPEACAFIDSAIASGEAGHAHAHGSSYPPSHSPQSAAFIGAVFNAVAPLLATIARPLPQAAACWSTARRASRARPAWWWPTSCPAAR